MSVNLDWLDFVFIFMFVLIGCTISTVSILAGVIIMWVTICGILMASENKHLK